MDVKTNKSSKKKDYPAKKLDTSTPSKSAESKPSFNVRPIKNGWLVSKSWSDKDGRYHDETEFCEENPLEAIFTDKK